MACGFHFQATRPSADLRDLYDEEYFEEYAGGGGYSAERRQREHEAQVRLRLVKRHAAPPGQLLEVGAAGGHFLAAAGAAGYSAFGVEPVTELAERARSELGVDVEVGFLEDIDLGPGSFDVACAFHVLEHMPTPLDALRRVRAALRPGGLLVVEVPNIESFEARRSGTAWGALEPLHHVGHYGPRALRAMVERAGFAVTLTETVPFYSYLRPAAAVQPTHLAHRLALSARARVAPRGPHPDRHELLRALARASG